VAATAGSWFPDTATNTPTLHYNREGVPPFFCFDLLWEVGAMQIGVET